MLTTHKLLLRWSAPCHIASQTSNSYKISTLEGFPINGLVHAHCLHHFIHRDGIAIAEKEEIQAEGVYNKMYKDNLREKGTIKQAEEIMDEEDDEEQREREEGQKDGVNNSKDTGWELPEGEDQVLG